MKRAHLFFSLILVSALCGAATLNLAQTVSGTIEGRVTDPSGAVIPTVSVSAKNISTGSLRNTETNADGFYLMSFMPLGSYEIEYKKAGFKTVVRKSIEVTLNRTTVVDVRLEISAREETVTVTAEAPAIETTTGELKHSIESKMIEDTPLPGRNFMTLVEQIPGFQNAPWIGSSNNPTNSTGSYAAFSGTGSRSATFQIDGVNNDDSSENQNRQNVNISSIKEFQVLTNTYSAEFGRGGGAVVLVQTKSGTNRFHGDAYDFIQNDWLNANGFFRNRAGNDPTTGRPLQPRQRVRRNQYGWTIGGPVMKDRIFFFHSSERVSNVTSSTIGRFIWLPNETPRACAPGEVATPRGPYCVDPATHPNLARDLAFMKKVMDLWKTPELEGKQPNDPLACADMIASGRPNRCVTVSGISNRFPDSEYSGRMDFRITNNDTLWLRYQYNRQIRRSGRIIFGDNFGINNNRQYNIGATYVHVFTPRQVGEFRFGFGNRATLQDVVDDNAIPTIRFANTLCNASLCGTIIGTSTNVPINRRQQDFQYVYNHTISRSRHTIKMGVDQRFQRLDDLTGDRARGFWTFSTLDSLTSIRAGTGFTGWENFLRGFVTGYQQGYGNPFAENRFGETNLYYQDDIKLKPNFTLNLGVRYEYVRAPKEDKDRFTYGYENDRDNIEPRIGFAYSPMAEHGWLRKLTGGPGKSVIRGGYGIAHSRLFQSIFSQNQLSIRTQPPNGFARDFSGLCRSEISDPSCGFVFTPGTANRSTPLVQGGAMDIGGRLLATLLVPDPNLQVPYVQSWNLTVEREIPGRMSVQLSYNGNRMIGGAFYDGENQAQFPIVSPSVLFDVGGGNFKPIVFDRACTTFNTICTNGPLTAFSSLFSTTATPAAKGIEIIDGVPHGYVSLSTPRYDERRPNPNFIRNLFLRNFSWSYYNAALIKVTKKTSRGLSFTGSYTWSKAIDTGSEATFTGVDTNTPSGKTNAARSLRALSGYHAEHRMVLTYSYLLPWRKDQRGILGRVIGGWNISGVTTFQSGNPFTVSSGYDINLDGVANDRPLISDLAFLYRSVDNGRQLPGGGVNDTGSQTQLPGNIFIPQQAGTIAAADRVFTPGTDGQGSIGRNSFFTHGINNFDMSFFKTFRIREGHSLIIRMEFYNIFNRVMFDTPARTILSTTPLGRITAQRNPANFVNSARDNGSRMGQFAIRYVF